MKKKYLLLLLLIPVIITGCTEEGKSGGKGKKEEAALLVCHTSQEYLGDADAITDSYYKDKDVSTIEAKTEDDAKRLEEVYKEVFADTNAVIKREGLIITITKKKDYTLEDMDKIRTNKEKDGVYTCE